MGKGLLVLFDGNSLVHRAFHAFSRKGQPLTVRRTGEMVSAVYGFALMLLKVLQELVPTRCAVAFDRAAPTFRHIEFPDYKSNRPETPDELVGQLSRARELVSAFNIPVYELDGYEADDILGTLAREASAKGIPVVIVTGDADTMQLANGGVRVLYPNPGRPFSDTTLFDAAGVREKYGVSPNQIADFKALKGDPSDNIPGVPGVGEKTAVKLIQEFGSIDGIYARVGEVNPPRLREALKQHEAQVRESLRLATIVTDVPVAFDAEKCQLSRYDRGKVVSLFRELEFFSLVERLPEVAEGGEKKTPEEAPKALKGDYRIINTEDGLRQLAEYLLMSPPFSFDTETDDLDAIKASLVGVSFSAVAGAASYLPVGHRNAGDSDQLPREKVLGVLKPVLENGEIAKIAHNGKFDITVFAENGVSVAGFVFDTMVAAYLLGEKNLGLKALALSYLGIEMVPISELIGEGKKAVLMSEVCLSRVAEYCGADSDMALRLSQKLKPELEKQGLLKLFTDVEMPLVPVLSAMERNGVLIDTGVLGEMSGEFEKELAALESEIYKAAGHEFNINSTQQLGVVLFEELGLPAGKKTKTGYSTEAAVLEGLRGYEIVNLILEYRTLSKLKSTYIDALPGLISPKDGRVHTSFNQTRTTTGRLSSSDPNLQNIPVRTERGRNIRKAFLAPPGARLLSADYSQIDLRVLAHLSHDPKLIQVFREGRDAHAATASDLFHLPQGQVTPDMRRLAKTVNFGVIYGMSEYGLEQATELTREEAKRFIADYFEKYPAVGEYLEATKKQGREKGYVQTLLNRRRYIPEIHSPNRQVREAAERMAINMPVQGTSADIIKVAMVELYRKMGERHLQSKMLLQVHDELIFEIPEPELGEMRRLVPEVMSSASLLSVPLKVDVKTGQNWGEMD